MIPMKKRLSMEGGTKESAAIDEEEEEIILFFFSLWSEKSGTIKINC